MDTPENTKLVTAPASWQELFVQKQSGGVRSGKLYEQYWSGVEKVADEKKVPEKSKIPIPRKKIVFEKNKTIKKKPTPEES